MCESCKRLIVHIQSSNGRTCESRKRLYICTNTEQERWHVPEAAQGLVCTYTYSLESAYCARVANGRMYTHREQGRNAPPIAVFGGAG